ncbi:carboxypeptidase-like regulatory domain-containing protein [Salegentibacter sp.]|uniref:carboxypeptidase-like regulatory domain-containing protein n=1 Tax=Salegentibacter sp. TaxID=1903072 RepID=UPI003564D3D5
MNKTYLTCFLSLILVATGFSQEIILKGKVTDAENLALAFVNIGIPKKHTGTVSNENGEYKLKIPSNILENDTVVFSYIGYKTIKKSIVELKNQESLSIQMETEENQLEEVVFETKKFKDKKLGRTNKGLGLMHFNFYTVYEKEIDDRLSKELGMNFKLRKNCRLEKFNFAISQNEFQLLKFRINIYSLKNGQPRDLIISDNIIFEIKDEKTGWKSIDLNPYNIYLKEETGEFLLTIQWVESNKSKAGSKFFSIPASKSPFHKIYYRDKAMDKFESQTGSLSMYLDAKCSN